MNKFLVFSFFFLMGGAAFAACEAGDNVYQKSVKASIASYQNCAIIENDEDAQLKLASIYQNGAKNVEKDEIKTLLFLHLAADNGNADAQTKLAKMLLELDETDQGRQKVLSYMKQIKLAVGNDSSSDFKGEVMHPFVLLTLAAESSEQKWYYPTAVKYSAEAASLLKSYQIDEGRKKELIKQGVRWKQRKMMETAKEVLTFDEYEKFKNVLYPSKGRADPFLRKQALSSLREKIQTYLR